jgi:hypothetical protein
LHDSPVSEAPPHPNVNSPKHEVSALLGYDGDTVAEASDEPDSANTGVNNGSNQVRVDVTNGNYLHSGNLRGRWRG